MAEPFLCEIRLMSFNYPPKGWAFCNGQFLPINQNQTLFALLGTTFGGNGQTNFALPDLRGRLPIHVGSGHILGERGGEQSHTLSIAEIPQHNHMLEGTQADGTTDDPTGGVPARSLPNLYGPPNNLVPLSQSSVSNAGGSQAHLNMQPYLTLNFVIALQGIFPSPN
jgi:microcystin-dependent protein